MIIKLARAAASSIVLAGGLFSSAAIAETLVFGHALQQDHPYHLMAERFKEELEAKRPEMKVDIFPAGQLGNERTLLEGLQTGSVDVTTVTSALTGNFVPEFRAMNLPFIFRDVEHLFAVMDSDIGDELAGALLEKGFVKLGYGYGGARDFYSHDPITTLDDLQGKRLRVMESKPIIGAWQALGADPQPIAWNDVYMSLQQRLVDGAEGTGVSYRSMGFDVLAPNYSRAGYIYSWHNFLISETAFNRLNEEQKAAVLEAAEIAVQFERETFLAQEAALMDELRELGVDVHEVTDLPNWADKVQDVYEESAEESGGMDWINRIRSVNEI